MFLYVQYHQGIQLEKKLQLIRQEHMNIVVQLHHCWLLLLLQIQMNLFISFLKNADSN
ncbi:unnamed protein product [Paramecium sonneborni]|uniref:Uncharacterized protein n=1 Tax=Paramecium sonneborni TaxID=65129 RepID=A0A8S1RU39_9CILI|nr:unnamed protein product [Paramecium sonneborni]